MEVIDYERVRYSSTVSLAKTAIFSARISELATSVELVGLAAVM
jgi:hypothetical protein